MLVILVGGSCVGKTTLETRLVRSGFIPLKIYTTRPRRADDPRWVITLGKHYVTEHIMTKRTHALIGVNGHRYYIEAGSNYDSKYITSIIDLEEAKAVAERHVGKVRIIQLTRSKDEVIECLLNRGLDANEIWERYNQYLSSLDNDTYKIDLSKAFNVIKGFHD